MQQLIFPAFPADWKRRGTSYRGGGRRGDDLRDESRDKSGAYVRRRTRNVTFSGGPRGNDVSNESKGGKQRRDAPAPKYPLESIDLDLRATTISASVEIDLLEKRI